MRSKRKKLGKKLTVKEEVMLRKSQKDIKLGRIKLFEFFYRNRKRLRVALRERCTGPYILYLGSRSGFGKVIVLPLEKQLANLNGKVLKEPLVIEELD